MQRLRGTILEGIMGQGLSWNSKSQIQGFKKSRNMSFYDCHSIKFKENGKDIGYIGNKIQPFQEIYRYYSNRKRYF